MDQLLEADDVPVAQYQEVGLPVADSSNRPERHEVVEDFDSLRNRPAQPQESHVLPGRNQDGSGETFQFDRSNPDSDLLDKGGLGLRVISFYDWPKPMHHIAISMAKNGLFYTGNRDRVECSCCMTRMRASELWEDSDIRSSVCLEHCPYTAKPNAV